MAASPNDMRSSRGRYNRGQGRLSGSARGGGFGRRGFRQSSPPRANSRPGTFASSDVSGYGSLGRAPGLAGQAHFDDSVDYDALHAKRVANGDVQDPEATSTPDWDQLDISKMTIRHISPSLSVYPNLRELNLSHNMIQSVDPACLASLHHLAILDLSYNAIAHLSEGWGKLSSLESLDLSHNHIQYVPFDFGLLYKIKHFNLQQNPPNNISADLLAETDNTVIQYLRDVSPPPPMPPLRHLVTSPNVPPRSTDTHGSFTLFCYNVLCDKYATAQMYPYTPSWALEWEFRKSLIIAELLNAQADILCLQEVQMKEYENWLRPELQAYGYDGRFTAKSRAKTMRHGKAILVDGCATFYRTAVFAFEDMDELEFSAMAMQEESLRSNEEAFTRLMTRDNVALLLTLRPLSGGPSIIVANTHVHFDPKFSDVKVIQVQMLLQFCYEKRLHLEQVTQRPCYPVVCGDFNSLPDSGVYDLLANGVLSKDHPDMQGFTYGHYTQASIRHRLRLTSAYASILGKELDFTNCTPAFKGVIDYIWVVDGLVTEAVLAGVSEADAMSSVALPNAHFPSDHISLMAKIRIG